MGPDVEFDVTNLNRVLDVYAKNSENLPMPILAQMLDTEVSEVFETQGTAGTDGAWAPFAAATLRRHPRRVGGMLLQDTGVTANMQTRTGDDWAQVFSPSAYGWRHSQGSGALPKRDFLAIDMGKVTEEMAEFVAVEIVR